MKRVFLIVLDSLGIGEMPDSEQYNDCGSNTLGAITKSQLIDAPNLQKLGLFNIEGVDKKMAVKEPLGCFARLGELSKGKDTTIGHWEIAGIVSEKPLPTFPNGFPKEFLEEYSKRIGFQVICNKPYSGTDVIRDYGEEHQKTKALIVYTSADSVFQVASHEEVHSVEKLYEFCQIARDMLVGDLGVGRVIARPFLGEYPNFYRTSNRHDFSLQPSSNTMLDILMENGLTTYGIGKIYDIFAGKGINKFSRIKNNIDGMEQTIKALDEDFTGLCFVNLVDFDMVFGHRNDVDGYAKAVSEFDVKIGEFMSKMKEDDLLILTADHGCDPSTPSTDHSREYVPMLAYGKGIKSNVDLKTRWGFCDIASTILDTFGLFGVKGKSFLNEIK